MEGKDAIEKTRARRSRASPAARVGAESVSADQAAQLDDRINEKMRPGATSVGGEQAARLDERIAAKQGRASTTKPAARSSTRSPARQLNEMESEVAAKTRVAAPVSQPGAVHQSDTRRSNQLNELEQDVAAKTRAAGSHAPAAQMNQLEQDMASKNRVRTGGTARQDLDNIEDRIAAKTRRATSSRPTNSTSPTRSVVSQPGARQELDSLEGSVSRKSQGPRINDNSNSVGSKGLEYSKAGSFRSQGNNPAADNYDQLGKPAEPVDDRFSQNGGKPSEPVDDPFSQAGVKGNDVPRETAPQAITTVAHGMANQPDVEYGTYGNGGHGFDESLAIAVAVSEEEEDAFIPAAIEFDPDSKPPIYKNRRFRFYLVAATILLAVIGVGAALGVTSSKNNDSAPPTASPTTERESKGIADQFISIVGEAKLADRDSPHFKAADWIINKDPMALSPEADNLIQRYLLTLFYLSTTETKPWLSCNPPVGDETKECNFTKLAQVFPEVKYENMTWGRWLSDDHECSWAGILCDEFNQTRAVELPGQEIRGTFPSEIALMPYLQSLTFNWNELYGTMPSELASMKHLLNIEFHYNFFTGQVPPEWYTAQALQRVNFAGNFLSGTIPTEIGQLSTMKGFFSFENSIGGTIPTEIGNMKFLSFTRWARNFMTGTMPSEVGKLEKLQELWFHRNQFTGQLPSEMGTMRDMGDLRLHYNHFNGTVPEEHYNMPQLRRWDLYDMNLTGTISTNIGKMSNLATYRIRGNHFAGGIPTEMGQLGGLVSLWLHMNDLIGEVPLEVCSLRGPAGIEVLDADCGPTNGFGAPLLECMLECCTACCDTITGYCIRENTGEDQGPGIV